MLKILRTFDKIIIVALLVLMMITVFVSTLELTYVLLVQFLAPPFLFINIPELQETFGYFFMVLIGLELIETIKTYLQDNRIHVEVVFLVAMIAIARKVIILDYETTKPEILFGIAAIIIALTAGYYLVKKAMKKDYKIEKNKNQ